MRIANTFAVIIVVVLFSESSVCRGQDNTPVDVVRFFNACYGGPCMDETAAYTTERFRDNKPKSVWVVDTWNALQQTSYEKLQDDIIGTRTTDTRAVVVVKARIKTLAGETEQKEVYYLIKKEQAWLIDELQVTDETVEIVGGEFQL
jgi:hypothetical protein